MVILAILGVVAVAIVTFVGVAVLFWYFRRKDLIRRGEEGAATTITVGS